MPRDFASSVDDLPNRVTIAVAQVVNGTAAFEPFNRKDMRLCQINNVHVVADAGAIRGRIIRAVNLGTGELAQRHLEHTRYKMRFLGVVFTKFLRGTGGIEIAQGNISQAVELTVPCLLYTSDAADE